MSIALKVSGTSYTLTQAQLRSLVHTTQANAPARLVGQIYRSAIPTADWAAGDTVELWVGGVRRFAGWLGPVEMGCDARGSYVAIQAEDILGRLRATTFTRANVVYAGSDEERLPLLTLAGTSRSAVTLFSGVVQATASAGVYQFAYSSSSATQLAEVVAFAAQAFPGALALGTITGLSAKNIPEKVTDMDCLSVLQRCLALRPDAVLWVDPSGATPLLHAAVRSALTPVTVSVAAGNTNVRGWSCRDRSDRLIEYLNWRLQYTYKTYVTPADPAAGVNEQQEQRAYTYGDADAPADRRHVRFFNLGAYAPHYGYAEALGTPYDEFPSTAAADYWAANSVLHHEGGLTLYEPAGCTYTWALGQTLSLSGAAAAYESANALVRGCTYDNVSGQTEIDFGPPDQLGAGDLLHGASSLGGITPTVADVQEDDPAQSAGGTGEQADTLTQRLQDKLGSFALQAGSGFQMATMDVTATIHGFAEYIPSVPPRAYRRYQATGSGAKLINGVAQSTWGYSGAGVVVTVANNGSVSHSGSSVFQWLSGQSGSYAYQAFTDHEPAERANLFFAGPGTTTYGETVSATQVVYADNGASYTDANGVWTNSGGSQVTNSLLDEDTDADALARAKAASTWSAWTAFASALNGAAAYQTVRTEGWSSTAHLAKIKATTLRSNIWGYPGRVSIPIYRYAIGAPQPSEPTSVQTFDIYFADTLENVAAEGEAAVWQHVGVASMPEWELPCEPGFVNLAGSPTVSLL